MNEKQEYVKRIFLLAKMRGIVKTQGDFAKLLDVDRTTLSGAFNAKPLYLTDRFVRRVQRWAEANGIEDIGGGDQPAKEDAPAEPAAGFWVPEEFRRTMENMSETIRIQAQMLQQYQTGAAFLGGAAATQKNARLED